MTKINHSVDRGYHDGHQDAEQGRQRRDLKQLSDMYRQAYQQAYLEGTRRLARHALLFARTSGDKDLIRLAEEAYRKVITAPMRGEMVTP